MVIKIGHRGASGYAPENTLKSFRKAIELGADAIELDVYVCKSKELVVIHDDKVDRTTNGFGYTCEKNLEELKKLDAGEGEKIPLLTEVLDLIDKKVRINIELKGENTAEPVNKIIQKYIKEKAWKNENFLISSFNYYELKKFNEINPDIEIGALITGIPIGFCEFAQKVNAKYVNPSIEFINQDFIDDAHKKGLKVYVWIVDDFDDIKKMKELGVDGIFSNFPDRL